MSTLLIDTRDSAKIKIGLKANKRTKYAISDSRLLKAQAVLPLIDKNLRSNNLKLKDINEIKVNTGPGSFTGLRVGISIANALGFFLKISVNGKKVGKLAVPEYK